MMTEEAADEEVELEFSCDCTTVRLARRFRKDPVDDEGVVLFIRPGSSVKKNKKSENLHSVHTTALNYVLTTFG